MLNKLFLLVNTIKWLRFKQLTYRIYYKLVSARVPKIVQAIETRDFIWSAPEFAKQSYKDNGLFSFLNVEGEIKKSSDWNSDKYSKLWLYNLHYFDDLNAQNNHQRTSLHYQLVNRWIEENPAVIGNGWEPYPLSLRLVNWIKWYSRTGQTDTRIVQSISQQAAVLHQRLEYHIQGNHLFSNAKALIFSGCFLNGSDSALYLSTGRSILSTELKEQFLVDGGHFELSPMYHCIMLWDLLDIINLAQITSHPQLTECVPEWCAVAAKALQWLDVMRHPDQQISFFNDSAFDIAATPEQLHNYARLLNIPISVNHHASITTLSDSGYSRLQQGESVLLIDHAAVGPDYLPGHAHADTLSIEWSIGAQRVFVNSGTSVYGSGSERHRQRQTAAHNTVIVDGQDSSEVWGGFRVARRAKARLISVNEEYETCTLHAAHDGYRRLAGRVIHDRSVHLSPNSLVIRDQLAGKWIKAEAIYHLHPDVICSADGDSMLLLLPSGIHIRISTSAKVLVSPSSWHPSFGVSIPNNKLTLSFVDSVLEARFELERSKC